jgi:RNA polymerase sigma-70 factor (ECF subfamily)
MPGLLKNMSGVEDASDLDLMRRTATGGTAAFAELMRRHNRRLFRIARGVVGSDHEAEDVVQAAWTLAFQAMRGFRGEAAPSTWLARIVLNEAFGRRRRSHPTVEIELLDEQAARIIPFPHNPGDPETDMERAQIREMLEQAIDELPETFRVVFIMRDVEEMSVEEVAASLGLPEATVKTRTHRARARLKDALERRFASTLSETFSFDGARCRRLTERVFAQLALGEPPRRRRPSAVLQLWRAIRPR